MVGAAGKRLFWTALALGLLIRVAVLTQTGALGAPIVDEQHYISLATNLLDGNGFAWGPGQLTSIRPPLYPAFVALVWAVAGEGNLQAVRACQVLLALLTVPLVFQLGKRVFGPRVGYGSAAVFWLYPSLTYFNFTVLTETLFTFLLVAFVLSTVIVVQTPRRHTALVAGVLLGLAALTRSVMWPLPIVLCPLLLVLIQGPLKGRMVVAVVVLLGFAATVGPWAVRNTRLQGVVTVIDTMGGINLRLGNYEHTPEDRMWAAIDLMTGERGWSYALTQQYPGGRFTEGEKDKWAQAEAIRYIREHPGTSIRRALIKFADFWGLEREFIASVQYGAIAPPRWLAAVAAALVVLLYVGIALAGVSGIWISRPEWRFQVLLLVPILLLVGVHTVAFGHSRYHIPLIPILAMYAVALLDRNGRNAWSSSWVAWSGAAVSVGVLVTIWLRQVAFADAERLRSLLGHGG